MAYKKQNSEPEVIEETKEEKVEESKKIRNEEKTLFSSKKSGGTRVD